MITKGMMSSNTPEWATPQNFFDELNNEFNFTLDPCATKENAKCEKYFIENDGELGGLGQTWRSHRVFMNPPYGRTIGKWVEKAYNESRNGASLVVGLLPARTDTKWFHDYIYGMADIRFIKGRLKFNDGQNPAPFPSMVVIWR